MKYKLVHIILVFIPVSIFAQEELRFDDFFIDKTMRIDYYHVGDATSEWITIDHIYQYGIWAGSRKNLADSFNNGRFYAKIYDRQTGQLIFSKGFDSYFAEYQTSAMGSKGIKRTYHESILIPYPKQTIIFNLEQRDSLNTLHTFYSDTLDPQSREIIRNEFIDPLVVSSKIVDHGNPHQKVDVAVLAEGYMSDEKNKFDSDVKRLIKIFFRQEPFHRLSSEFNFYAVFKSSPESGIDEPRAGKYKNSVLSVTFNSLGSERYVLTEDNKSMRDLAAHVPYDAIYIMVNHNRYGGGGIYNLYCTFTIDNQWSEYLILHEFGHSFGGLADEYYGSPVAYNEFFPETVEPVEPNITVLADPENVKWKSLVSGKIDIPTPWCKQEFDEINFAWQKLRRKLNDDIASLKRNKAAKDLIQEAEDLYDRKNREAVNKMDALLKSDLFYGKVGAFEGAGYSSTGLYRPMLDCIMFSVGVGPFCKVCEGALEKVIGQYLE
jgi:hypothetical protein